MKEAENSSRKLWMGAAVLGLIHLIFAMLFASRTPFLTPGRVFMQGGGEEGIYTIDIGAPDELQHVVQIGEMWSSASLPKFDPKDPKLNMTYEALQPPLYYCLAGGWAALLGAHTPAKFAEYLKTARYEDAERVLKEQSFQDTIGISREAVKQDGMKLRLLNALFGAASVVGVFALAFWGFGNRNAAFAAAGFAALLPMNIALSGAASNDPLLICLCTWVLAILAKSARFGMTMTDGVGIGFLLGLAFITKTTALGLVPVILLALVLKRKTIPLKSAAGILVSLIMGGAWWAYNQQNYGDPFAIKVFNEAFQGRNPTAESFISRMGAGEYWKSVFTIMGMSFTGVFSYMDIYLEPWVYSMTKWLFILLGLFGLATIFVPSLRLKPDSDDDDDDDKPSISSTHLINGVFLVVMIVLFIQFNRGFFQAQARYIMPAIGPIGCMFGIGIAWLCSKSRSFLPLAIWMIVLIIPFAQAAQSLAPGFKLRVEKGIPYP